MHQVIGLRPHATKGVGHKFFNGFEIESYDNLIGDSKANAQNFCAIYGNEEFYNLFYTAATCEKGSRNFISQSLIPFDLDKIDLAQSDKYLEILNEVIEIDISDFSVICSGNGLQVLLKVAPFDLDFLESHKPHYSDICSRIDLKIKASGLEGEADRSVWRKSQILRLPWTPNIKPIKEGKNGANRKNASLISRGSLKEVESIHKKGNIVKNTKPINNE